MPTPPTKRAEPLFVLLALACVWLSACPSDLMSTGEADGKGATSQKPGGSDAQDPKGPQ